MVGSIHHVLQPFLARGSVEEARGPRSRIPPRPAAYRLYPNYPNPFNPRTTIRFDLPEPSRATLRIYGVAGQLVRVLVDGEMMDATSHWIDWDGRDGGGQPVASGVYFYRLTAGRFTEARRLVLLR